MKFLLKFLFVLTSILNICVLLLRGQFYSSITEANEIVVRRDGEDVFVVSFYNDLIKNETKEYVPIFSNPKEPTNESYPELASFFVQDSVKQVVSDSKNQSSDVTETYQEVFTKTLRVKKEIKLGSSIQSNSKYFGVYVTDADQLSQVQYIDNKIRIPESNGCYYDIETNGKFDRVDTKYSLIVFEFDGDLLEIIFSYKC